MKNNLAIRAVGLFVGLFLYSTVILNSQTAGTLSFSVTTTSTGGFSPNHFLAIWIENNSTVFIKTKVRYTINADLDHMQTWVTKSGQNVVDAVTGATRTSHGTISFLWNGTNVAGTLVADGSYFVWLEMAWAGDLITGKTVNSFPFTKGPAPFHSTPTNTTNFLNIVIDWTASSTPVEGVLENKEVTIYPNPSSGQVKIDFKNPHDECTVQVMNGDGRVLYSQKLSGIQAGIRTIDFSGIENGIYFCRLQFPGEEIVFRLVLLK